MHISFSTLKHFITSQWFAANLLTPRENDPRKDAFALVSTSMTEKM